MTLPASLMALPEGWRAPSDADLAGETLIRRADRQDLYLSAVGDFNRDGRQDRAALLVSDARNQYGVFVFDGAADAYPVLVGGPLSTVSTYGLEALPDGRLSFFVFGSSQFLIAWDGVSYAVSVAGD